MFVRSSEPGFSLCETNYPHSLEKTASINDFHKLMILIEIVRKGFSLIKVVPTVSQFELELIWAMEYLCSGFISVPFEGYMELQ